MLMSVTGHSACCCWRSQSLCLCRFALPEGIPAFQAYQAAIAKVIKKKKTAGGGAHVIDMGTGAGLLAMMAAKAGADSVVACDLHEAMCSVTRKV